MPLTDPAVTIASNGTGPGGGKPTKMTPDQLTHMFDIQGSSGAGKSVGDFGSNAGDAEGYIVSGQLRANNGAFMPCNLAYYVVGGSTGTGYLYVVGSSDQTTNDTMLQRSLAHMMGCLSPADVQYAGLTSNLLGGVSSHYDSESGKTTFDGQLYDVPSMQRTLLVSMSGISFRMEFSFSQGMVRISLCYASAKSTEDLVEEAAKTLNTSYQPTGGEANGSVDKNQVKNALLKAIENAANDDTSSSTDVSQQAVVEQMVPYIVVPS